MMITSNILILIILNRYFCYHKNIEHVLLVPNICLLHNKQHFYCKNFLNWMINQCYFICVCFFVFLFLLIWPIWLSERKNRCLNLFYQTFIERPWNKSKNKQWNTEITKRKFDCWSIYRLSTNFFICFGKKNIVKNGKNFQWNYRVFYMFYMLNDIYIKLNFFLVAFSLSRN